MNPINDTKIMALYCDYENLALGVRDAKYTTFDIHKVLERLLLKGNIVVKKAYCDWEHYSDAKKALHEASFEMIEIPHIKISGKNSADIRMVVDALDLCYTKKHVDTFVILSGDSDFSPLVSKLRENNKTVIGVGVKNSTSDLLIANCDEFFYYDDLVRNEKPQKKKEKKNGTKPKIDKTHEEKEHVAWALLVDTYEDLITERGEEELIWGSMIKQAIKRRQPGFSESYYGFKSFGALLEAAEAKGILKLDFDPRSGGFIVRDAHYD
jgi:uncharacterized protein (TIGR00288 family)